ncbi:hypothetical protein XA68_11643 [Ophiocordyceps unilateralis]|uniref:Uncharacterized protein n=1 Tax=Ophiocordyceps unilateralis TaxID=268505 RepID=A0A2A9PF55_OPHUN|nr:hypothetical protein XA68_11643 [Ophiocordyceps unilateralis]
MQIAHALSIHLIHLPTYLPTLPRRPQPSTDGCFLSQSSTRKICKRPVIKDGKPSNSPLHPLSFVVRKSLPQVAVTPARPSAAKEGIEASSKKKESTKSIVDGGLRMLSASIAYRRPPSEFRQIAPL